MKQYINEKFPHFLHGGDYNPEQWIDQKEIWDEDMRLMRLANCNEMSVGIFSWATLEPEEGKYDFSFLDEIIDKIYANGGRVVLATPSGARPRWMAEKYPEVLRVDDSLRRMHYGARHNHCYTSPVYREKVAEMNRRLAERYGKHPAVIAWHLSNEYSGKCYCPLCQQAFREFVKKRYDGDIHKLNTAWWTTFWSHAYTSFDQVEMPGPRSEKCVLGLNLDHKRFSSYQTVDFMKAEIAAIREFCPDLPVTTNMMPEHEDINYFEMAKELDVISWDSYPIWHSPTHARTTACAAFWHDTFRSMKQRPHMLMESVPGAVSWREYNKLKRPGMDRLSAIQTIAHGGDTVQYFQFRKGRGGYEKLHGAIVDHEGSENTRVFRAVAETGATLKAIDEICGTEVRARVAIVYDWENRWALELCKGFAVKDKQYSRTVYTYHAELWKRGIATDVVSAHSDLSKYDLVIAPMLYMTDSDTVARLEKFVAEGGTLYATYMLGMVDESDLCYLGGFPGGGLRRVFGIWNEEIDTFYPEDRLEITMDGKLYEGVDYAEYVHTEGASSLAELKNDFYGTSPALTVNEYGKGRAYYQTFRDRGDFFGAVCDKILGELNIHAPIATPLPELCTVHERNDGEIRYLFVENYSGKETEIALGDAWTDMESGETVDSVSLNKFDVRILKK
ncbi:MAG: beta-galactosidase [Clostridia bacterium]|nr:beta-galactosidase [Clostridia bacterium]